MSVALRVLSGARAGKRETFAKSLITIGRHPLCDLRFDPERDRDVSARHAEIVASGDAWLLRDSRSTNGTFVNGARLTSEHVLAIGDTIGFGDYGPKAEVTALAPHAGGPIALVRSPAPRVIAAYPAPRSTTPSVPRPVVARASAPSTNERIARAVAHGTRGVRRAVGAALALVLAVGVAALWSAHRAGEARQAQVDGLLRRSDSLTAQFDAQMRRMSGTVAGLDSALAEARGEGAELRARLARAGSDADVTALTAELHRSESRRAALATMAEQDNTAIARANAGAVALLAVRLAGGRSFTGTAFAVSPRGLMVTNRHLVRDDAGRPAERMLVMFSGESRWLPAHLVLASDADDLAFVQVEARGPFPAVAGVTGVRVDVGAPLAIIGYPLGMDAAMDRTTGDTIIASPTLGVGTASKALRDVLQIDAFAGEGSSGSPVFDRQGRVVGVIFGGARESSGRIVYAVPADRLVAQMPGESRSARR